MKKLLFIITTILTLQVGNAQTDSIDYFGQTPPGKTAVVFAPGIISRTDRAELKIVFSPDGNECYLYSDGPNGVGIYYTEHTDSGWSEQKIAPFSVGQIATDPFYNSDGSKLYYTINSADWSNRDIWAVERSGNGWLEPIKLPEPFNTSSKEMNYTETTNGVVYLQSDRNNGNWDIWRISPLSDNNYRAENLGSVINSAQMDLSPCIAPDESYLIFSSTRPGGYSGQDLYISFNKGNREWTAPVNMNMTGANINTAGYNQGNPSLSPDGKFLFFCKHAESGSPIDIYWVSAQLIIDLKKAAFAPKLNLQISDINISTDSTLNFAIPSNTFSCEYGVETLQYSAALSDGSPLPSWLTFNSQTRTLSGKPTQAETINIKITATNADTVNASSTFKIIVTKVTGIEDENEKLPSEFKLNQNYPNPFNPSTLIGFQIPAIDALSEVEAHVMLKVYDLLGREISTLVNENKSPGNYEVEFNAASLTSGIYFYCLRTNDVALQKKMVLVR